MWLVLSLLLCQFFTSLLELVMLNNYFYIPNAIVERSSSKLQNVLIEKISSASPNICVVTR